VKKSKDEPADSGSDESASVNTEEVLKPFHDASVKFLEANFSAQESAMKHCVQAYLDFQNEVRKLEQQAYDAVMEATKKHVDRMGQRPAAGMEEMYSARVLSQMEYENEVRRVYMEGQAKLTEIAQKASRENGGEATKQFANQRQDAYQTYWADLQRAWSSTKALDPQTMKAIASDILCTLNIC
jgi:hypothetical protein